MKKKTIAVGALIILFVISLSTLVSAADLQDPYEAYGLEKGDEDIPFIMVKNPPDVIVLQPVEYRYGEVRIPLSIGQITLKKGEDYSFDISPEWKQGSTSISVKSHVTIKYRQSDDPRVLLETGHQTEMEFVNARRLEVGASGAVRTETHNYEDGYLDVSRPNYVYLQDASMPHRIGDFKQIQSLHHELCHAIEHQHDDTGGDKSKQERHSYFIQYLTDVVKALADMERGVRDVESAVQDAIQAYYEVFYNSNNAQPQTFSWFGVKYITQHKLFERYADFDVYAGDSNIPDSQKQLIAKTFREKYFPGNLQGKRNYGAKFKETTGTFKDASWTFKCSTTFIGLINGITLEHPDYKFTVRRTPQWVPGTLKIQATYDVESIATGKTDTLEVELDGGSFDPGDYHYPKIDKFTVTWRATDKISDCIMGQPKVVSEAVKI